MAVTIEQVIQGVQLYGEQEFVAKVSGLKKWAIALSIVPLSLQVRDMLEKNRDMLVKAGYMTEDGMIDIDLIADRALAIARSTGSVKEHLPLLGDTVFSEQDILTLKNIIVQH